MSFNVTATDDVDLNPSVSCDHSSGTFPLGATTVNCSATDASNNSSSGSFSIAVVDTTDPVFSDVPDNITTEATSSSGANVTYTKPTATDSVSGNRPVSCSPGPGSPFSITTTTVTCSASDGNGNTGTASFTVKVQDTEPPSLTVSSDLTVEATSPGGATVNCRCRRATTSLPLQHLHLLHEGIRDDLSDRDNDRLLHGDGLCGQPLPTGSFHVTVRDSTPPSLSVPGLTTAEATSGAGAVVTFTATATDALDGSPTVSCNPGSGSTFLLGNTTVSCTASDHSGNTSNAKTFTVKVQDTTDPTISLSGPGGTVAATSSAEPP